MKKLLNKTLQSYTLYAMIVLAASVPVYYYLVDDIWLTELDEHNEIIADKTENELRDVKLRDDELAESIALWNRIQPGTNLTPVSFRQLFTDSTYTVWKRNRYVQNNELKRFRGYARDIKLKNKWYRLTVETNVEETEETVLVIAGITFSFFLILVIGFLLLTRYLSVRLWKPFRNTLAELKTFDLHKHSLVKLEPSGILEFEEMNEELRKLLERNVSAYRLQKQFIENASHELQTPLAILKNKMDLMLQKETITDRQYNLLEEMNGTLLRISRINKNLLLLAKIENHQFTDIETLNLKDVISQCLLTVSDYLEDKHIRLRQSLSEQVIIKGNRTLLEIMINNLILNAIRHSPECSEIDIRLEAASLSVCNTGSEALPGHAIFERFIKDVAHTSGSGLGLAIIREIAHLHHWSVEYKFENGFHCFTVSGFSQEETNHHV